MDGKGVEVPQIAAFGKARKLIGLTVIVCALITGFNMFFVLEFYWRNRGRDFSFDDLFGATIILFLSLIGLSFCYIFFSALRKLQIRQYERYQARGFPVSELNIDVMYGVILTLVVIVFIIGTILNLRKLVELSKAI